ncbi:MAG: hypothetical protein RMN52_06225 [Anaerolineae bacterium]|nr:hypothetical protein [Candidatus Roseilinea sp.]MDW8449583.1 hypothetical protein [Anaerolineae bacterium]
MKLLSRQAQLPLRMVPLPKVSWSSKPSARTAVMVRVNVSLLTPLSWYFHVAPCTTG